MKEDARLLLNSSKESRWIKNEDKEQRDLKFQSTAITEAVDCETNLRAIILSGCDELVNARLSVCGNELNTSLAIKKLKYFFSHKVINTI